jgi:RNA polymerase sigma-70 factor (ECF subfamily)
MTTWSAEADNRTATTAAGTEPAAPVPSFHELCEQYLAFVWRCARAFGAAPDEIDDVVQDVFLVVQRRHAELRDRALARNWIYSITRRVVSTHRRRRRRRDSEAPVDVDALGSPGQSPLAAAEQQVQVRVLSALLDGLDERKREVFVLAEILEMSGREISETLGVPMNTVYSRLRAAREEFELSVQRYRKSMERRKAL